MKLVLTATNHERDQETLKNLLELGKAIEGQFTSGWRRGRERTTA